MDMSDYRNKRNQKSSPVTSKIQAPVSLQNPVLNNKSLVDNKTTSKFPLTSTTTLSKSNTKAVVEADEAWELDDDDGWGDDKMEDLKKFDYKNTDLNKMTDY